MHSGLKNEHFNSVNLPPRSRLLIQGNAYFREEFPAYTRVCVPVSPGSSTALSVAMVVDLRDVGQVGGRNFNRKAVTPWPTISARDPFARRAGSENTGENSDSTSHKARPSFQKRRRVSLSLATAGERKPFITTCNARRQRRLARRSHF